MNKSISGIVLILAIISGCSIEFKDLTPTEQPIWTKDCAGGVSNETWPWRIPSAEFLWESTRNDQLKLREEYHFGYFFVLESKSKLTKVDKAVVVIDGVDFEMGQEGNLYYYNHQDRCKTEYTYYYRIDYATVTKLKTHYIYSENEPAISKAPFYFGNMLIFAECMKPKKPNNCASLLQLYDAEEEFHYINVYVMNTNHGGDSYTITECELSEGWIESPPANGLNYEVDYQILSSPEPGTVLHCGDMKMIIIQWKPYWRGDWEANTADYIEMARLTVKYSYPDGLSDEVRINIYGYYKRIG